MSGLLKIEEITDIEAVANFKAYSLESTAGTEIGYEIPYSKKTSEGVQEIIDFIAERVEQIEENSTAIVELVVQIHGYNTDTETFEKERSIAAAELVKIQHKFNNKGKENQITIFLAYHWPSKKVNPCTIFQGILPAFWQLPGWIKWIGIVGLFRLLIDIFIKIKSILSLDLNWLQNFKFLSFIETFNNIQSKNTGDWIRVISSGFLLLGFRLTAIIAVIGFFLVLLRLVGYFQDNYRATHYGVLDLVQFFRTFEFLTRGKKESSEKFNECLGRQENRINISFVAHSMGAFVTTNTIRILSDVFDNGDSNSNLIIDTIDGKLSPSTKPSSHIGECFNLNRLVMVSPDIPVNAILDNRSNFLASSLVRFKESYLFSNEADMVLLLLSTVANYISFPSTVDQMGYKLGNIGVKNPEGNPADRYQMAKFVG
jgi:hypothetical protein